MKKCFIFGFYVLILLVMIPISVQAKYKFEEETAFNYGGTADDKFNDLDFFSDGSYVAVGSSKSSFRNISNADGDEFALISIFDKNSNILMEKSFAPTNNHSFTELFEVGVVDDNSFVTCGMKSNIPFCAKYNKNGEEIWINFFKGENSTSSINIKEEWDLLKTSDNGFLVASGVIEKLNSTTEKEIVKLAADGTTLFVSNGTNKIGGLYETSDKYLAVGGNNATQIFEISKSDGSVLNSKTYSTATASMIRDIKKTSSGFLLGVENGVSDESNVFNTSSSMTTLTKIDSNYEVEKTVDLEIAHDMSMLVLDDEKIITIAQHATTPTSTDVYLHDKDLNELAKMSYKSDSTFELNDLKVNPIDNKIYMVGSTKGSVGNHANIGGEDAVVIVLSYVFEEENALNGSTIDNQNTSANGASNKEETKKDDEEIENPNTGSYFSIAVLVIAIVFAIVMLRYARKKNRLTRL